MNKNKNIFGIKSIILIVIISSLITSIATGIILYNNNKILLGNNNVKNDKALQEFLKVYNGLDESYYTDINKTAMIDAAISAMLNYLGEDYSTYLNEDETKNLAEHLSGKYNGIGISIANGNEIMKVHQNTPASKVGLQKGDKIISINGTPTTELTQAEVANLISKTSENTIEIDRNSEILQFVIKAEIINSPLPSDIFNENEHNIGYIQISAFTNTVGEEFSKALGELEKENIESLIIDMRNNSGGYLKGATDIANLFLKKDQVIYSLEGKDSTEKYKDDTEEYRDYRIMILINEGTASASEVLAAALKDSYGAVLVGETSYGKGKVQQTKKLEDGSMVKYTTARWLRPNGDCIDEIGLEPDYQVPLEKNENGEYIDSQLLKAKELLTQ